MRNIFSKAACALFLSSLFVISPASTAEEPGMDLEALAKSLANFRVWLIETYPIKEKPEGKVLKDHLEYQFKLEREGIMFASGPLKEADTDEWGGLGLLAYRADSLEEAKAIADADPMHSSGTRGYSIRQWIINEGQINVTLHLSGQNPSFME